MYEVCFSKQAGGMLRYAASLSPRPARTRQIKEPVLPQGADPAGTPEPVWEERPLPAAPLRLGRVLCLGDDLSMGPIGGGWYGPERKAFLREVYAGFDRWDDPAEPDAQLEKDWERYTAAAEALRQLPAREKVRLWVDRTPAAVCGAYAAAGLLYERRVSISLMRLRPYRFRPADGSAVTLKGWGEADPEQLADWAEERVLPVQMARYAGRHWERLRQENSPLRALVAGRLLSVPADFYDGLLLAEARRRCPCPLGHLVVGMLGRQQLPLSDWLIARRTLALEERGVLQLERDPGRFYNSRVTLPE